MATAFSACSKRVRPQILTRVVEARDSSVTATLGLLLWSWRIDCELRTLCPCISRHHHHRHHVYTYMIFFDIVGDSSSGEEALQYENWWKTMPTFSALLGVFPNLLVQLLLLLPCGQRIVMYTRFCTSILIMTACLVIVLLLCFVGGSSITEASALVILLLSITVCGAATD